MNHQTPTAGQVALSPAVEALALQAFADTAGIVAQARSEINAHFDELESQAEQARRASHLVRDKWIEWKAGLQDTPVKFRSIFSPRGWPLGPLNSGAGPEHFTYHQKTGSTRALFFAGYTDSYIPT